MNGNPEEKIVPTPWPKGWVPPLQDRTENTWRLVMGYLLVSLVMMPILLKISLQDVPPIQEMLAYALFCICTWPVVWHFSRRQPGLPVFPIVCLVYAVSLALPVFYAEPILSVVDSLGTIRVMDNDTTRAVQYSILGVLSLQFGFVIFRYSIVNLLIPRLRLELDQKKGQTLMILLGLFGLVLTSFTITGRLLIPTRYLAATTLLGRVSILSTSFLYVQFLRGRLDHTGKMFLLGILLMNVSLGLGLGAVRSALDPMLAIGAVHWMIKRRISWKIAFIAMVFFVIMQAVKGQFRTLIYSQAVEERGSVVGRLEIWQQLAHTVVSRLMVENKQATATSVRNSFGRMDMIHIFGHAIDETPRHVPFQEGKT